MGMGRYGVGGGGRDVVDEGGEKWSGEEVKR